MQRFLLPFLLFLFTQCIAQAQTYSLDWVRSVPGQGYSELNGFVPRANGDVFVAGRYGSDIEIQPGPDTLILDYLGGADASFMVRYNSVGDVVWANTLYGINDVSIFDLKLDAADNVYVAGEFDQWTDFDPGPDTLALTPTAPNGFDDGFVAKYDSNGALLWVIQHQVAFYLRSLSVDSAGNAWLMGNFNGTIDLDPGPGTQMATASGTTNTMLLQLDPLGNFVWATHFGDNGLVRGNSLARDANNNLLVAGTFEGSPDFAPDATTLTLTSMGIGDGFAAKFDATGQLIWAHSFASSGDYEGVNFIEADPVGNAVVSGYFEGTIDLNPEATVQSVQAQGQDYYVAKFDPVGGFEWAFAIVSDGYNHAPALAIDPEGRILLAGQDEKQADLDPGWGEFIIRPPGGQTKDGVFASAYNSEGEFLWGCSYEDRSHHNYDQASMARVDELGNFYFAGQVYDTTDFDCGADTALVAHPDGYKNFFWLKQNSCDLFTDTLQVCSGTTVSFPDGSSQTVADSMYHYSVLDNGTECDSTIKTIVFPVDEYLQTHFDTVCAGDSYTFPDGTFINHVVLPVSDTSSFVTGSGCDSTIVTNVHTHAIDTGAIQNGASVQASQSNAAYQWLDCGNNYAPLPNASGQTYFPFNTSLLAVEITLNGCTDTSSCIAFVGSGLSEIHQAGVWVYPNPTSQQLHLQLPQAITDAQARLFDLQGRLVEAWFNVKTSNTLQLHAVYPGVYLLELNDATGVFYRQRIVVE